MAKIKYSALVSDMRNKLNGSVLSKNRYGSFMRNKVTPVNPQTIHQQNARQILSSLSSSWGGLTEAQRLGWNALAMQLPFTDIFGDIKHLSGQVAFVKLNANMLKMGVAINENPPVKVEIPPMAITGLSAAQTAGALTTLSASFDEATTPAGYQIAVYATPPVQPGKFFVKNLYRFIGTAPAVAANDSNILSIWNNRFGSAAPGNKIFVRVALVSTDSGQQGIPSQAVDIIS